ncbi:unnamed protein product [Arabidopsis thaliana]|uniref:(thale cress) hypothetical protein n=1 Tax=Arabidopsis thaliana TaxID=3702 RepID=A0A7G2F5X1_ARATH|nr:unnamed protein product [Arabidopsis thaliana]
MGTPVEVSKLHFLLFPFMAHGHMIPTLDMAKLFATKGAKSTILTTPLNAKLFFEKPIKSFNQDNPGLEDITIQILNFPCTELGLPDGCENTDFIFSTPDLNVEKAAKLRRKIVHKPQKRVASSSEPFVIPELPGNIVITEEQIIDGDGESDMGKFMTEVRESEVKSSGVVLNSFYELEHDYADFYKSCVQKRAWHIGPLSENQR